MNLADNLKKIRKDNHLSQEQLAEKLGVSRQSISKWELGIAYPELDKVVQLCNLFNLNIDDLLNQDIKEVNDKKQSKININKYIDDFLDYVTKVVDMFSSMNFKQKIKCIFEQFIIMIILLIVMSIIGVICQAILTDIISFLPANLYYFIFTIMKNIYFILCIVLGIILILTIFKTRYLDYYVIVKDENLENIEVKNMTKEDKKIYLEKKQEKIIIRDPNHSGYKFITGLLNCLLFLFKLVISLFGLGFCFTLIILVTMTVLNIALLNTGLLFLGGLLILVSFIIINLIILYIIYNFIFSKKIKTNKCAITFVSSLIIIGIGIALLTLGLSKIEYVNDLNNTNYYEVTTTKMKMSNDLIITGYNVNYIESDDKDLKVEFKHSKYYDVTLKNYNGIYSVNYSINNDYNLYGITKTIIDDIKNLKFIDYSNVEVNIYTNKENIEILEHNLSNYYKNNIENEYEMKINDIIDEYENQINDLNETIDNLNRKIEDIQNEG